MMTADELIAFERRIADKWERGELPCLLHLSGGNEQELISIFGGYVRPGDWVFSTHRNHYHALLAGIPAADLERMIDEGRSMFVYSRAHNFLTSSVLAGTCCIAAGVALDIKRRGGSERVWCFLGDGAEEEGHFFEGALFVEANDLPCTFVIEDNQRQVDTDKVTRRGVVTCYAPHQPLDHFSCVRRYRYAATYPHAGSGCAHKITFDPAAIERLRQG